MNQVEVKVTRVNPDLPIALPEYASEGSAGFDIRASHAGVVGDLEGQVFGTNLAFEIPPGYVMYVFSRSGHGFKNRIRLGNCVGVIDSDFRGELKVLVCQDASSRGVLKIEAGDRIAQGVLHPIPRVVFKEVSELSETERGSSGLGSTGVK